jgi:hypothetical protein
MLADRETETTLLPLAITVHRGGRGRQVSRATRGPGGPPAHAAGAPCP